MNFLATLVSNPNFTYYNSKISTSDWIQIVIAVITLLAVLAAIWPLISIQRRRPKLNAHIIPKPPDSHKIALTDPEGYPLQEVIYVRIKVEHLKGDPAENVEVMLVKCMEYKNGKKQVKKNFLPLNLIWSHSTPRSHTIKLPAGLFRHCDLGYLYPYGEHNTRFRFDTIVQPNPVGDEGNLPNVIGKGKYEIELWISGDNTRTLKKRWLIEFDGIWENSEASMLKKHLKISKL